METMRFKIWQGAVILGAAVVLLMLGPTQREPSDSVVPEPYAQSGTQDSQITKGEADKSVDNIKNVGESLGDLPDLYAGGRWQEVEPTLGHDAVGYETGKLQLDGTQWRATLSELTEEELRGIEFREYYHDELLRRSWKQGVEAIEVSGYKLGPVIADGPYGSVWGYIKSDGFALRAIALSSRTRGVEISADDEPIRYGPPYEVELNIFVSGTIPLEDISLEQPIFP